jgi:hypothetical protein
MKEIIKLLKKKPWAIFLIIGLIIFISGCYFLLMPKSSTPPEPAISGVQDLALNEQDLQQLGMTQVWNETDCQPQNYTTFNMDQAQYSICNYTINSLNDTWVVIELEKFINREDLNDTYQYGSEHLYSIQGLISENTYGDLSRFRVNNVNDYGGQYNDPNVYYYHLWITKNVYLIHITSRGAEEARDYVPEIGLQILSKFK